MFKLFKQLVKARLEIDSLQAFEKACGCAPCWPFGSSGRRLSGTTGGTARLSGADGGAPAPNRTASSRKLDARANLLCSCGGSGRGIALGDHGRSWVVRDGVKGSSSPWMGRATAQSIVPVPLFAFGVLLRVRVPCRC